MEIIEFNKDYTKGKTDTGITLYFKPVVIEELSQPCEGCFFDIEDDCKTLSKVKSCRCMKNDRFQLDKTDGIWVKR